MKIERIIYEHIKDLECIWSNNDFEPKKDVKCYHCDGYNVICREYTANNTKVIDIGNDTKKICQMAAHHLIERGLRYYAFCGYDTDWSREIGEFFADFIRKEGFDIFFYEPVKSKK